MNFFDRILLTIQTLLFLALGIVAILFSTRLISHGQLSTSLQFIHGRWEVALIGIALVIASMRLLFTGIKTKKTAEAVIENGEFGAVAISLVAIESLVLSTIRNMQDVRDVKVKIKKMDEGVSIKLNLIVNLDVVIPETAKELQNIIRNSVERTTGIVVKDVRICVENVSNQSVQKTVK